jgi:gliding motility-associated-like protein
VPNAFSPNGDGKNDILYVRGEVVREVSFKVYDRWGEKVFETSDLTKGWDGTFRGQPCEPGVYDYHLQVTCLGMKRYFKKGNVTLLR